MQHCKKNKKEPTLRVSTSSSSGLSSCKWAPPFSAFYLRLCLGKQGNIWIKGAWLHLGSARLCDLQHPLCLPTDKNIMAQSAMPIPDLSLWFRNMAPPGDLREEGHQNAHGYSWLPVSSTPWWSQPLLLHFNRLQEFWLGIYRFYILVNFKFGTKIGLNKNRYAESLGASQTLNIPFVSFIKYKDSCLWPLTLPPFVMHATTWRVLASPSSTETMPPYN